MSEQQTATSERGTQAGTGPHLKAVGQRWGELISQERQAELQALLDAWNNSDTDHSNRSGPFSADSVRLTGADVFWLAEHSGRGELGRVPNLRLGGANIRDAHLEGANLREAHLEGAKLSLAHLEGADLREAYLEGANLNFARLKGATFFMAHLEEADLTGAHLESTVLGLAHLEGADLDMANLKGADLGGCWLDSRSRLATAKLDSATLLGDIQWGGVGAVDLTQIDWESVPTLGDERDVGLLSQSTSHAAAVRAYRQLAAQLRAQGMNEVADRFAYRAQTCRRRALLSNLVHDWRRPWRWPRDLVHYLGSLVFASLAGYGYRPGRTFFWYVVTVLSFMGGYLSVTHGVPLFGLTEPSSTQPLQWYEALVLSLASFHGRGFFPQGINLGDPVAILAASEAVIGLFIEISFIATFTQRYFSR